MSDQQAASSSVDVERLNQIRQDQKEGVGSAEADVEWLLAAAGWPVAELVAV